MRKAILAVVILAVLLALTGVRMATPVTAVANPIKHVVVIYEENHSFDSLLGFWCNSHPGRCPDGGMPASVHLSNGATVVPGQAPDVVPVVRHRTEDQQDAIDNGVMDGWQMIPGCGDSTGYACVAGQTPSQEPNLITLANTYAISDMTFSMQDSPSWFGHLYAVAASTDGFSGRNPWITASNNGKGWGCDSNKVVWWHKEIAPSCIPKPGLGIPNGGAFKPTPVPYEPTIMDRLDQAGLNWRIYGAQCVNETSDTPPDSGLSTCQKTNPTNGGRNSGYGWNPCAAFAECLYSQEDHTAQDSQFISDAQSGNLSAFSLVTPGDDTVSEHNGYAMTTGDNWISSLVSAVMNGPDWGSTAIFITWDDCGCFYDQVPPGINPDGTPQGPRVPLLIVSPYAKSGYTDTTPTTFAGILAYTESTFGLSSLGVNDAQAYDFRNAFDYSQTPLHGAWMVRTPISAGSRYADAHPDLRWSGDS